MARGFGMDGNIGKRKVENGLVYEYQENWSGGDNYAPGWNLIGTDASINGEPKKAAAAEPAPSINPSVPEPVQVSADTPGADVPGREASGRSGRRTRRTILGGSGSQGRTILG